MPAKIRVSPSTAKTLPSLSYSVAPDSSPVFFDLVFSIRLSSASPSLVLIAATKLLEPESELNDAESGAPTTNGLPSAGFTSSLKLMPFEDCSSCCCKLF